MHTHAAHTHSTHTHTFPSLGELASYFYTYPPCLRSQAVNSYLLSHSLCHLSQFWQTWIKVGTWQATSASPFSGAEKASRPTDGQPKPQLLALQHPEGGPLQQLEQSGPRSKRTVHGRALRGQLGMCSWGQGNCAGCLLTRLWVGLWGRGRGKGEGRERVCGLRWRLPPLVPSLLVTNGFSKHRP